MDAERGGRFLPCGFHIWGSVWSGFGPFWLDQVQSHGSTAQENWRESTQVPVCLYCHVQEGLPPTRHRGRWVPQTSKHAHTLALISCHSANVLSCTLSWPVCVFSSLRYNGLLSCYSTNYRGACVPYLIPRWVAAEDKRTGVASPSAVRASSTVPARTGSSSVVGNRIPWSGSFAWGGQARSQPNRLPHPPWPRALFHGSPEELQPEQGNSITSPSPESDTFAGTVSYPDPPPAHSG